MGEIPLGQYSCKKVFFFFFKVGPKPARQIDQRGWPAVHQVLGWPQRSLLTAPHGPPGTGETSRPTCCRVRHNALRFRTPSLCPLTCSDHSVTGLRTYSVKNLIVVNNKQHYGLGTSSRIRTWSTRYWCVHYTDEKTFFYPTLNSRGTNKKTNKRKPYPLPPVTTIFFFLLALKERTYEQDNY